MKYQYHKINDYRLECIKGLMPMYLSVKWLVKANKKQPKRMCFNVDKI
jgi:hypothetical protein